MNNGFDSSQQNIHTKIIVGIERLATLFRFGLQDQAKKHHLTPLQVQIILFIGFHPRPASPSAIAEEFALTRATVSDAIKTLIAKGLVEKIQDSLDARKFSVCLTAEGKQQLQAFHPLTQTFDLALDKLSEADCLIIWQGILTLFKALNPSDIPVRMCYNCQYYQPSEGDKESFCSLMQVPLPPQELRLDCPEHLAKDKH